MMIRREIQLHKQKPDLFITKRRGKPSPEEVNISVILPRICGRVKSSERLFQKCRKELTEQGAFAFPESRASERESARKSVVSHARWKSSGSSGWRKRAPRKPRREDAHLAEQVQGAFQANRRVYGDSRTRAPISLTTNGWLRPQTGGRAIGRFSLAVVPDVFSPMVGGWSMAAIQDATLVEQARPLALTRRRPEAGLLHHSDRGRTSTSESSQALLQREGMRASRSRTADCDEHAARERFFHVSQGHALMASRFRHEHGKGAPPLIPAHVFPIEPADP